METIGGMLMTEDSVYLNRLLTNSELNTDGCLEWKRFKTWQGYGKIGYKGKQMLTHRLSYLLLKGRIPKGMCVLHTCDNPSCINTDHLFLGTNQDNINDKVRKGRQAKYKGEESGHVKLSSEQVLDIRNKYASGNISQRELSRQFKIDRKQIYNIVRNKQWSHL